MMMGRRREALAERTQEAPVRSQGRHCRSLIGIVRGEVERYRPPALGRHRPESIVQPPGGSRRGVQSRRAACMKEREVVQQQRRCPAALVRVHYHCCAVRWNLRVMRVRRAVRCVSAARVFAVIDQELTTTREAAPLDTRALVRSAVMLRRSTAGPTLKRAPTDACVRAR